MKHLGALKYILALEVACNHEGI